MRKHLLLPLLCNLFESPWPKTMDGTPFNGFTSDEDPVVHVDRLKVMDYETRLLPMAKMLVENNKHLSGGVHFSTYFQPIVTFLKNEPK